MKFIQAPAIHSKRSGGVTVLLEKNKQYVRELNSTAGVMWEMIRTPQSAEEIATHLCREFNVDKNEAKKDAAEFLDGYQKAGLIRSIPDQPAGRG